MVGGGWKVEGRSVPAPASGAFAHRPREHGFGASLLDCTCSECMVVKLLLGRTNPQMRLVMPRRGKNTIAWGDDQWIIVPRLDLAHSGLH